MNLKEASVALIQETLASETNFRQESVFIWKGCKIFVFKLIRIFSLQIRA